MTREELEALREGWDFEAKFAAGRDGNGAVPDSFWETYSAMANTSGGVVLLGAKERRDGTLDFRGVPDIAKVERELWDLLENPQKASANVLRREDVEVVQLGSVEMLVIRIVKAGRADRPVYVNGSWERGTYVRVHEGDRRVTVEVARRMLADAIKDRDSGLLEDYSLDDLEPSTVRRYREFLSARRPDHPYLEKDDEEFLIAVGAAGRKRGGGGAVHPTWAGLWMLGKETAIRDLCPYWHLSYLELPENPDSHVRWLDRVHPDGMWNANLFEFYARVIVKLHDGLKVPFQIEQGQFRKDETPVHEAVREALVNTLVHADYQGTTGVKIRKSRSGFAFVNPGLLLVSAEQLWRGGVSEPRNPQLHRLFGLLRLGEREGSGGPAMRNVWREEHWRSPHVWEDVEHVETHLELPLESLLPEDVVAELDGRFGVHFRNLDELGRVILVTAQADGSINHARIRELSDAHSRDITLKLQELVRNGFLESSGGPRWMTYSVAERGGQTELTGLDGATEDPARVASSDTSLVSGQSALIAVRSSGRAPQELVDEAIVEACTAGFATVAEIAERIGRAVSTIRIHFVPRLVREGRLEMRFPDSPTHHNQAYRTTGSASGATE